MIRRAQAKPRVKGKRVKKKSVASATNLDICGRTVRCTRNVWMRRVKTKRKLTQCKEQRSKRGSTLKNDFIFAVGEAVIAAAQRPETHICIAISMSNWLCARRVSKRHSTAIVFD